MLMSISAAMNKSRDILFAHSRTEYIGINPIGQPLQSLIGLYGISQSIHPEFSIENR